MSTFKEKLAKAKLPRRTVEICLAGDLVAEFEQLERQLAEAGRVPASDSLEDSSGLVAIAEQIEALREQMREATETFVVQALPRPRYRALKAEHPPRQDDEGEVIAEDRFMDANLDTLMEPLFRACLVEPEMDDETWAETVEWLSDRQYDDLMNAAIFVNKGGVSIPFSRAASAILQSSGSE